MGVIETIIWFIIVSICSFIMGYMAISYTYKKNSKTPKLRGFTEADQYDLKSSVSARDMEEDKSKSVDGANALKGFKQN